MQLIFTKLYVPPVPADYVPRPHLLKKLGEVSTYKLTILCAPAGFGKTTLLGSWFREISEQNPGIQLCWLSLDAEDNEPARFLDALISALEDAGVPLNTVSPLFPVTSTGDHRAVLDALLQDLSALSQHVVLIFDDCHLIESKEVQGFLRYLVSHAPQAFHILISTRTQPPFETSKLRISGQLLELGPADLRFSIDETREYLNLAVDISFLERDIVTITEKTEGWIAGLKMAVLAMQKSEDPAAFVKTLNGNHRYIFDYLVEQVLQHQPQEVKEFLLATSIVETFNSSLCDALIQDGRRPPGTSQKILTYLEQSNLFMVPLDDERQWFRYHHLFSELLRSVLQQTAPQRVQALHAYASDRYECHRMISDAISHAIAAGDIERASRMVSANVLLLVEQTELQTVLYRLDTLFSGGTAVENPWLTVAYGWVLAFSGEMKRAFSIVQKAESELPQVEATNRVELQGNLLAIQAYIHWNNGDFGIASEQARRAEVHLSKSNTAARALNLHTLSRVLINFDQLDEALQLASQAADIARAIGQSSIIMLTHDNVAYIYHSKGQISRSIEISEQALQYADEYRMKYGRILPSAAGAYIIQAHNYHDRCDLEKAYWYAKRAVVYSEVWGQSEMLFSAGWIMAQVLASRGQPEAALRVMKAPQLANKLTSDWDTYLVTLLAGQVYLHNGEVQNARRIVSELKELSKRKNLGTPAHDRAWELNIELLIIDNEIQNALSIIDGLLGQPYSKENRGAYQNLTLLLFQAWAYQSLGDNQATMAALETALQYAEPELNILPFLRVFRYFEKPLRSLADKGTHKEILERIFTVSQMQGSGQEHNADKGNRLDGENLIEPLTERELEILRLLNSYLPTPEIVDMLAVSVNTVRTHIKSIYAKLGVHSRTAAIDVSKRLKLLA